MRPAGTDRGVDQVVALAFGAVHVLVGLAGFLVSCTNVAHEHGESLLGFDVNILHTLVHLAIGAALVLAARSLDRGPVRPTWSSARPTCCSGCSAG